MAGSGGGSVTRLMIFGQGFTASAFRARRGGAIDATRRVADGEARLGFDGTNASPAVREALMQADELLVSIPPQGEIDPVLTHFGRELAARPRKIVYLSTIGVYGNHDGNWIDESAELRASNARTRVRVSVEHGWRALAGTGSTVSILRLSGIYGPGRSALDAIRAGTARRIIKAGQVFNRIHVDDIALAIEAALARPGGLGTVNVTDDEPAPPQDIIVFAAGLLGVPPPPEQAFAGAPLSDMARSFYGENKRVSNRKLREDFGVNLRFPSYREGLRSLASALSMD
ncbi:MAG: NAD(P)-dependent oxidoreductase [Hyphomicrobiales bacterium]|nr:NAD(P)-dependent oxidoreductase [Hyphomicrobiales bacterium]